MLKPELSVISPLTEEFLDQIADTPDGWRAGHAYAASVILPETRWAPETFLARITRDLSMEHNQRALARAQKSREDGELTPFSFSLTAEDGGRVHFQAVPRPMQAPGAPGRIALALAAQPLNSKAPFDTKNELFTFLEVLPTYVLLIDSTYTIQFANGVARQFFGQCEGKKCYTALHGRSRPCISCPPFGLLTDKAFKVHEWLSSRNNTVFRSHSYPFAARDDGPFILQVGINITADVRARNALDLSEQRYRSIAENLTLGLALTDVDKTLVTLNPKMEEWFGPMAAKGIHVDELLQHKCCDASGGCVFDAVLRGMGNREKEFSLALPSGEERYFRLMACPILSRARKVRAIVIMLEDITDRRNLSSRMQRMQRLEALGSLAGGIAHEINQPLSALHLYASGMQMLLEQGTATQEQSVERLGLILAQADRIRQIISHMRALVMQEDTPACSAVLFADAAADALGLVGAQLEGRHIGVTVDIPAGLPPVRANEVQLEQVIINLLVNAMHALDSLPAETKREKRIRVTAAQKIEGTLTLHIADNGPGVGDLHSRIFDPFFTTKAPNKGMGLGLSIVHAFVTGWGGSIEVGDNPDGYGAVFSVTLSIADPSSAEITGGVSENQPPQSSNA